VAADDYQGAADALLARRLGAHRAYVLYEGTDYGRGIAVDFIRAAHRLGIAIVGSGRWVEKAANYHALAAKIADRGAQALFIGGSLADNGATLIRDLRAGLGPSVHLIASDGFAPASDTIAVVGSAAEGLTVSAADTPVELLPSVGRRFVAAYRRAVGEEPSGFAIYAAQATNMLLDAIARSDGTRASVIRELFRTKVSGGILGSFSISPTGDTTQNSVTITQVRKGHPVTLAVIAPPAKLVRP